MKAKVIHRITSYKNKISRINPYVRVLYIANLVSLVGGSIYGLYYGVFLYKETFSLSVLAMNGLLGGLGTWLGYIAGILLLRRFGYSACFKISFAIMSAVAFFTAVVSGRIADWYMLLAVARTIPAGIYTASVDTMMIREFQSKLRNSFLQIKMSIEFTVSVVLPIVVGAVISQAGGYRLSFILAGGLYAAALLLPLHLPKPHVTLHVSEIIRTFKRPFYKRHAVNRTAAAGFNQINGFVVMIIPFIMIKDEFSVGILMSIFALAAAVVSLKVRHVKQDDKLKVGFIAYCVRCAMSFLFVFSWTAPIMIAWQLINKLVTPLHDPLQQGLDIDNDSLIMGKDLQEKALNINVLNNTLLFIGSTAAYAAFLFITKAASNQQALTLQLLVISFALWRFVNLSATAWINRQATAHLQRLHLGQVPA